MACCQSLLARRFLLWYILLASFFILPLTWEITNGCTLIQAGSQGYGLFKQAIYDEADSSFLGCVDYSQSLKETLDVDTAFMIGRTAGLVVAMLATIACTLCLFIQCFSKAGKTRLWAVMRWTFFLACLAQGTTFILLASEEICGASAADTQCSLGVSGYAAACNTMFLLGMVIATFCSLPPRNPVFRLWYSAPEYDTDKADSYDEDSDVENGRIGEEDGNESVSLFGGSAKNRNRNSSGISRATSRSEKTSAKELVTKPSLDAIAEDPPVKEQNMDDLKSITSKSNAEGSEASMDAAKTKSRSTYGGADASIGETTFQRHLETFYDHGVALGPGGIRRGETREGNQVIIVDEYPASVMTGGLYPPGDIDGTDIVKVRSEYCRAGRKTIREEYHKGGSRTITTTITILKDDSVIAGIDP